MNTKCNSCQHSYSESWWREWMYIEKRTRDECSTCKRLRRKKTIDQGRWNVKLLCSRNQKKKLLEERMGREGGEANVIAKLREIMKIEKSMWDLAIWNSLVTLSRVFSWENKSLIILNLRENGNKQLLAKNIEFVQGVYHNWGADKHSLVRKGG